MLNIVLLNPEIPQNTGNIIRSVAATGTRLHLIKPLGFSLEDKFLKRAGLDYFDLADVEIHENYEDFVQKYGNAKMYYASTKASRRYDEVNYEGDTFVMFGRETKGIPEELLKDNYERSIRIPMRKGLRSLNLSNSVAIVLYEALRQGGFEGLEEKGKLTKYDV